MSTDDARRWDRVATLVDALADCPPAERAERLARAAGHDAALHDEVASLLRALDGDGDFLETPAARLGDDLAPHGDALIGESLGSWTIVSPIAQGGMGRVYRAEHSVDGVSQQAAIKVLPPGAGTSDAVRRFVRERQILAGLDHPGICPLIDSGVLGDGRPYLVMRFLDDAQAFDQYCDTHQLSLDARLELFQSVCRTVHYLHQSLVVHGDLKPANVPVTATGRVQLVDFGIARWLHSVPGQQTTMLSRAGQHVTISHAAPEQLRGQPPGTASDVYALGVMLYQLISGQLPLALDATDSLTLLQTAVEQRPERPSARPDAPRWGRHDAAKQRDLDTIALKCLEKDPKRRYDSAAALADDLDRVAAHLPIAARPASVRYQAGLAVRRHRGLAVAAVLALAGLVGVLGLLVVNGAQQQRFSAQVAAERDRAKATNQFLVTLFEEANPMRAGGTDISVPDLVDRGAARLQSSEDMAPLDRAAALNAVAEVQRVLGRYDASEAALGAAEAAALSVPPGSRRDARRVLARSRLELANIAYRRDDYAAAERHASEALASLAVDGGRIQDRDQPLSWSIDNTRALALMRLGRFEEALAVIQSVVRGRRASNDPEQALNLATNLQSLANAEHRLKRYDDARRHYEEAIRGLEAERGPDNPTIAFALLSYASLLRDMGEFDAAIAGYVRAETIAAASLPPQHPFVGALLSQHALARAQLGQVDAAGALYERALALLVSQLGADNVRVSETAEHYADLLAENNRCTLLQSVYARFLAGAQPRSCNPAGSPAATSAAPSP